MQDLLVSVPVNVDFEKHILTVGLSLVFDLLTKKYPTQLEYDHEVLKEPGLPWRTYLAVSHRAAQKEILHSQWKLLSTLKAILEIFIPGSSLKSAYMKKQDTESTNGEMLANRIRLRKYLHELSIY